MVSMLLRDPQALSNTLAFAWDTTAHAGPLGLLKGIETLDSVPNYYIAR